MGKYDLGAHKSESRKQKVGGNTLRKVCCCSSASCLISNCCIRSISAARSGSVCWSITCVCAARRAIQVLAICNDSSMTHISAFANYIVGWSDNMLACCSPRIFAIFWNPLFFGWSRNLSTRACDHHIFQTRQHRSMVSARRGVV